MQRTSTDDPLALPRVPPPAPADHPWRDRILAALFALALPAFALVDPLGGVSTVWENRNPAHWPELSPVAGFPTRFEQAFADRFHSRSALLLFQHAVVAGLFRTSPAPNVLMGREGWLYWLGEDGRSLDRNFRGTLAVQDSELAAVVAELKRRRDFLAARGIPYLVTIVPEKFTIYPEYLPPWAAPGATPTPLARLEALLAKDGSVHYVDLVRPLRSAKSSAPLYYRTDSHWNLLGATVGYERIMRALQDALPDGRLQAIAAPQRPVYIPGVDWYWGDLARMVGVPYFYREPDYAPLAKVVSDPSGRCAQRDPSVTDPDFDIYHCARPELPKAVVYRDSMAISLIPLLSENFRRVVYVSSNRLNPALIERERPDVVIEEMVERGLLAPARSAM
jgi:alginate O-acetyltransferase complex protein AlgJ